MELEFKLIGFLIVVMEKEMPKSFMDCVKNNKKIVTKKLNDNKYVLVCYDKNGKSYTSEIKTRKKKAATNNENLVIKNENLVIKEAKIQVGSLLKLKKYFDKNYRN